MTTGRRNLLAGLAAGLVVVVVVVVLVASHSGSKGSSAASPTTSASSGPAARGSSTTTADPPPSTVTTSPPGQGTAATTTTTQAIPLQVKVSSTQGLHDGSVVTVTVSADKGSLYYGLDARLCAGSPAIENFYDYTPDPAGNCILKPLSGDSDAYIELPTAPPHLSGTLSFRVGVGTDTFTTENATKASITCGPGHPCQLVVRLQYPHGFGFRSFPITYRG